jgi:predicted N-acetyltransferase YhbS/thiamine kinase-like enzyme
MEQASEKKWRYQKMNQYKIRQIRPDEYSIIRKLDRDAFEYNERESDGDFHEVFADNIRRSPYYIPELDLVAVADDALTYLGHAIFSKLPMGDNGEHIVWLHSLAVRHGEGDNHAVKSYEYQRKGIGTALTMRGLEIAKTLGYTGCMTCGHPDVYRKKMGFSDYRELGINKDKSVDEPDGALHAIELVPGGFDKTNKLFSENYYDFSLNEQGINPEKLKEVLGEMFGTKITRADCQTKQLHGGAFGDIRLVTGTAYNGGVEVLPYRIVCKTQKKRKPPENPDSWVNEYYFYASEFHQLFDEKVRMPKCYHAEISDDMYVLWLEYINGVTGTDLTINNLAFIADNFGRFQGKLYKQPELTKNIGCLRYTGFMQNYYHFKRNQKKWYDYLRSEAFDVPAQLKQMLIEIDDNNETVFEKMKRLPVVLHHGDFHAGNIILKDDEVILIDWGDGAGLGYLGEDIVNLICDNPNIELWDEYYRKLIPAYLKGVSKYIDIAKIENLYFREMIIISHGYDIVRKYMLAQNRDEREKQITALQKLYEMREINV